VKVSITLEPALVSAVDTYVTNNPGTDRSGVIDDALRLWAEREQEHAMERQLREALTVINPIR
jgi:metal-responsive CopG/Arc/MetJ family transcriptional regulator